MKHLVCLVLVALFLASCAYAESAVNLTEPEKIESSRDTPLYESTQEYMDILRENTLSCTYRGKQGPTSESVFATFHGNNITLNTVAVFSDAETDCVIYVLRFVDFNGKNPDLISPLLDALNSEYRFAKFYSAPNSTVSVTLDLLFSPGNTGEICYDGLRRLLNICDECYEALNDSVQALPDLDDETEDDPMPNNFIPAADAASTNVPPVDDSVLSTTPAPVSAVEEPETTQQSGSTKIKIRNGGLVNVRQAPDQNSILVGTVEGGKTYECIGKADNGWYEIVMPNGLTGFISGKRVTELK